MVVEGWMGKVKSLQNLNPDSNHSQQHHWWKSSEADHVILDGFHVSLVIPVPAPVSLLEPWRVQVLGHSSYNCLCNLAQFEEILRGNMADCALAKPCLFHPSMSRRTTRYRYFWVAWIDHSVGSHSDSCCFCCCYFCYKCWTLTMEVQLVLTSCLVCNSWIPVLLMFSSSLFP